ncbi:MAG: sugar phosphate isomerase/epimerase [Verrucomicrobiota bacterium]
MRIGFTTDAEIEALDFARQNGFGSIAWMRFDQSFATPGRERRREEAMQFATEAKSRAIRISAIGAFYRNPLDPAQTQRANALLHQAIDVAALIGVRTVSGFPGGVIETTLNPRGGQPVITPLENFIPQVVAFWEPVAKYAADKGVRLAFEHCPQGIYRLPVMNYNLFGQPANWERFFNATTCENIGLEWDAGHLICQFIDPVENLRKFGAKVFHVHAKDAFIHQRLLATFGICHPGVAEHRLPGFGQANWSEIIHELLRAGYDSDLNIEGFHDPVFKDHPADAKSPLAGRKLEREGWLRAKQHLEQYVPK